MPNMDDIIQRLRDLMTYKGLNISDTAKSVGITQPNLSSILAGKRPIGDNVLNKFVLAFNVNKKWLLSGEGEMLAHQKDRTFNTEAERFKMIRQSLELTIPEIAEILGVATSVIEGIENDAIPVNNLIKQKMKATFDINPLYIVGNAEKVYVSSGGFMQARKTAQDLKQKKDKGSAINNTFGTETRPRIPYAAAAGALTSAVEGIMAEQCEQIPRITAFPDYDFTIIIKGNSMEPKYEGGDEVACKRVDSTSFIQWGKVHVMDTAQGIVIKRVYEDGDKIRCVSYNPEYPDFSMEKDEIYSMSLVVGLLRM